MGSAAFPVTAPLNKNSCRCERRLSFPLNAHALSKIRTKHARTWRCVSATWACSAGKSGKSAARANKARTRASPTLASNGPVETQPQYLREIVKQQNGRPQHGRILRLQNTRARSLLQHARRRRVEDFRRGRGMHQLQILRNELDIDEPAGGMLEIPGISIALFRRNRAAHFHDVGRDRVGIAPAAEHLADRRFDRGRMPPAPKQHAHASAPYAPKSRLRSPGSRRSRYVRGERPGAARRPQPHVDLVQNAVIGLHGQRADQSLGQSGKILAAIERTLAV